MKGYDLFSIFSRATSWPDRLVMVVTALFILGWGMAAAMGPAPSRLLIFLDNRPVGELPLDRPGRMSVAGRLGEVVVEVAPGQGRLLEFASPRLIGTRTGWISRPGQVAACVPCGVVIQVAGRSTPDDLDAIAR